mmetsp:Transcript_60381/g.141321  ORF Transcript_60381/g.141321 Transcript_60381/m.141321 type:complete len:201 (+) Transcript_60381:1154-1756(+)
MVCRQPRSEHDEAHAGHTPAPWDVDAFIEEVGGMQASIVPTEEAQKCRKHRWADGWRQEDLHSEKTHKDSFETLGCGFSEQCPAGGSGARNHPVQANQAERDGMSAPARARARGTRGTKAAPYGQKETNARSADCSQKPTEWARARNLPGHGLLGEHLNVLQENLQTDHTKDQARQGKCQQPSHGILLHWMLVNAVLSGR